MMCQGPDCFEKADGLCDACWDYRRSLLSDLPSLWRIATKKLPREVTSNQRVSGGAGPSSTPPLRSGVLDTMEYTLSVMLTWAQMLRIAHRAMPLPDVRHARAEWLFCRSVSTCRNYDTFLEDTVSAVNYYGDLYRATRRLRMSSGVAGPQADRLHEPCPACDSMTVITRRYGDHIACLTCHAQWGHAAFLATRRRSERRQPVTGKG